MTILTTVQAINEALGLKMAEDNRVFCLGEDAVSYTHLTLPTKRIV